MDDSLHKVMQDRMSKMRAQAHRGRSGMSQVMRTDDGPKPTYVPSMATSSDAPGPQGSFGTTGSTFNSSGGMGVPLAPGPTSMNGGRTNSLQQGSMSHRPDDSKPDDDEGAERLRQKLQQMGISESVAPQQSVPEPQPAAVRMAPKLDITDKRGFLGRAPPKVGMVCCHIVRDRSGIKKLHPEYSLYLESGEPKFLLAARKRKKNKTSNYLISMDPEDLHRNSGNFYGKVRSNFLGTEFTIYDRGEKPSKEGGLAMRQELAAVLYETNIIGTKGPRRMTAIVPAVDSSGKRAPWKPDGSEDSEMLITSYKNGERLEDMLLLENKKPQWDEALRAYVLNFKGRVTVASVKNFQLVERGTEKVLLQFGKTSSDKFTLDFQYPINGLQAFSIALTAFDNKLACE
eukprot:TRINITY_DN32890_c0_g1_i2.p1 TRINITY_DN32890_c0_g1~~TRINITY_DN32890_c0_g1_i2.p1  ORF type:complete len:418 (+),score=141.27 TRINITY_DN32890_c0_g1_i2:53-1255(+)